MATARQLGLPCAGRWADIATELSCAANGATRLSVDAGDASAGSENRKRQSLPAPLPSFLPLPQGSGCLNVICTVASVELYLWNHPSSEVLSTSKIGHSLFGSLPEQDSVSMASASCICRRSRIRDSSSAIFDSARCLTSQQDDCGSARSLNRSSISCSENPRRCARRMNWILRTASLE
jgi:hypothetical protein